MIPIETERVQQALDSLVNTDLYVHLETTSGAYTKNAASAFIRNARVRFSHGRIKGDSPYRVGLKMPHGWIFAEGLTDWEPLDDEGRLLLAGHDSDGKLTVALQLSPKPFSTHRMC